MGPIAAIRRSVVAGILAGTFIFPSVAVAERDLQILLVGSSLVRGVKPYLKKLYREEHEIRVKVKGYGPARWELQRHANSPLTAKLIGSQDWDFIFLAQSSTGGLSSSVYPDITKLFDRAAATGAQVGFLMTWFGETEPLYLYDDLRGTEDGTFGYVPLADVLGAKIAPAGWAIREVVVEGNQVRLWRKGVHLRGQGKYLAAATVFAAIEGRSPLGLWAPESWATDEVEYLQALAHDTLVEGASDWNVSVGP